MRKLLLFFAMLCVSIGAWAEKVPFGSKGSWYEIDGTTATIYVAEDHDLGRDNASVYQTLAAASPSITKLVFDSNSRISGTDVSNTYVNSLTSVETIDLSGVTLEGGNNNYYFGTYTNVKSLILADVTADKQIEIAGNPKLEAVLITPTSPTHVQLSGNNNDNEGVIINGNVIKDNFSRKWEGSISSFETYNQDFIQNATTTTANKLIVTGSMSREDAEYVSLLTSLSEDIRLLDMSGVTLSSTPAAYNFPFGTNPHLYSVVLPKDLNDVQVWWVEGCTNLYAAISYNSGATNFKAYVGTPGRLKTTILDAVKGGNTEFASDRSYLGGGITMTALASTISEIKLSGTLNAVDISSGDVECIDSEGHVGYQGESTESLTDTRTIVGSKVGGTLTVNGGNCPAITTLDLSGAYFPVYTDMTLSAVGYANSSVKKVLLPTDSRQNVIPAYMFQGQFQNLFEICIPSNYEVIKTCAFAKSAQGLTHIWTTDANPNTTVDNGVMASNNTFYEGYAATDAGVIGQYSLPKWGTYTFSANLKLIESYAFATQEVRIKDVYVLATVAPECHVDAFNVYMYIGQSGFGGATVGGIVTREAYKNGNVYLSMLHYPRDCDAPYVQRYTDMGREYSVATGDVDGKGANIYYPTYSEFLRAYLQGTYGFLWNSIDDTRANGELLYNPGNDNQPWSGSKQGDVNSYVSQHPGTYTSGTKAFSDAIFYDVTLGGNSKPTGMKDYWDVTYGSTVLYPKAVSFTSNYVYYPDANGKYVMGETDFREYAGSSDKGLLRYSRKQNEGYYSCPNGEFVQDYSWIKDDAGLYILDGEYTKNTTGGGAYVEDYTWGRDDANGTHYHPLVSTPFPGDQWGNLPNDFNNAADYWYATYKYDKNPNGEYVPVYGQGYYTESTVPSHWAEEFQRQKAAGETYTREPLGYNQCTSNEEVKNHKAELFTVGDTYALWTPDVIDFVNGEKFARNPIAGEYREYNPSTDEGCDRYDITGNGYVLAVSPDDDAKQHYTKNYIADTYRAFDSSRDKDDEPKYCYGVSDYKSPTPITYTDTHDYRGWHQFVLNGFAANSELEVTQHRSYLSDNDWWTICLPYNLTYSEMMFFYGTVTTDDAGNISMDETKVPYLSQLVSVTRDMKAGKITLNFSKNLMNHSQVKNDYGDWVIGDAEDASIKSEDKVVLHAGVPYMIRPYRTAASGGSFTTQFDIYGDSEIDEAFSGWRAAIKSKSLYNKLVAAQALGGSDQMAMVKNGLVTVPALVVNADATGAEYTESTDGTVTIGTKEYKKSSEFDYTFVGSFYKSFLPPYSYYLGYKNGACFFYADIERVGTSKTVGDKTVTVYPDLYETMKWNNNTCIIVPNMLNGELTKTYNLGLGKHKGEVTPASGSGSSMVPAQWVIGVDGTTTTSVRDDLKAKSGTAGAKSYTMVFGVEQGEIVTGISEVNINTVSANDDKIYTIDGQQINGSSLPKGLYIKNGKKIIVK